MSPQRIIRMETIYDPRREGTGRPYKLLLRRETIIRKRGWLRSQQKMGWFEAWEATLTPRKEENDGYTLMD